MTPSTTFSAAWTAPSKWLTVISFSPKNDTNETLDKLFRQVDRSINVEDYAYLDSTENTSKARSVVRDNTPRRKRWSPSIGPFEVISNDVRVFITDRE